MSRKYLNQYKDGDAVEEIFLLAEKTLRANRHGTTYLSATLRDKTGAVAALQWNVVEDSVAHLQAGDFLQVRGKMQLYQGALQIIVTHLWKADGRELDPADFHPQPSGPDPGAARTPTVSAGVDGRCRFEEPRRGFFCRRGIRDRVRPRPRRG